MRYFIEFAYRGTDFHGSQIQPNGDTVQAALESAFATIMREPVSLTFAGRTDAGVHAEKMIAHFDVMKDIPANLGARLNNLLPNSIAVHSIRPVIELAHARFDATSRTYYYRITTRKDPFLYPLSWKCPPDLDFDLMNQAAARLLDYTDFTSFSKLHTDVKTNNCRITHAQWAQEGDQWVFTITADRFLRNMVRAIVGTLVEVGRHKMTVEEFCQVIERKDRCAAGTSMPGHALFLWDITYPYNF